jgi:hypothetical protein
MSNFTLRFFISGYAKTKKFGAAGLENPNRLFFAENLSKYNWEIFVSQGELLKMHLLESRLLDTFFQNVNCSTEKS